MRLNTAKRELDSLTVTDFKKMNMANKTPILEQIIKPEIDNLNIRKMKPRPHPPFSRKFLDFKFIFDKDLT
jgi:hypothetical protein